MASALITTSRTGAANTAGIPSHAAYRIGDAHGRELVRELYKPDWKAWLGEEGGARDGSPNDPRIALILVQAESVTYMKVDKPRPVVLFEVAKAMVMGDVPDVGSVRTVNERELRRDVERDVRE